MLSQEKKELIVQHLKSYNPKMIGIFGSYARNEQTLKSDLDILVDFKDTINLLDLIGLEMELSEILGIKVDLITERSINPSVKPYIYKNLEVISNG